MPEIPVPNLDAPAASSPAPAQAPAAPEPTPDAPIADSSPAPSDVPAASSPADAPPVSSPGNADPKSELLKAITKATSPKAPEEADAGKATAKSEEDPASSSDPDELPENVTPEEMASYGRGASKRIKGLLQRAHKAEETLAEVNPFISFVKDHNIASDDVAYTLQAIVAIQSGDNKKALEMIGPVYNLLMQAEGLALPEDLQQQVAQGRMARDVAAGVSRQRYELGFARQEIDRRNEIEIQRQDEANRADIHSAVSALEQKIKQTDPDYAVWLPTAMRHVRDLKSEYGEPANRQEAEMLFERGVALARDEWNRSRPARVPTQMQPSGVQRPSNPSAMPTPRNTMDAVLQSLRR